MAGGNTIGPINPGPVVATPILPPQQTTPQAVVTNTQPNPKILEEVSRQARELVLEAASIGDAEPYAFGTVACKPMVIAADDTGDTLVLDCLWSVGEVQSVCNAPISGNSIWAPDIGYLDVTAGANFEHFTGTAGQSASTIMTALKGSYSAYANKAHSVISMQDTWNLNWLGFVSGVKVADPRLSPITTKIFSENPALILADIFDRSGYTIDWDSVLEAANYADTPTYGVGSPMDPRWAIRGHITTKQTLAYHVHALAQYAGCYVDVRGGTAIFVVDKPRSSNHTVVAGDIVAGSARLNRRGSKNAPSKVSVNVLSPGGGTWTASYGTSNGPGSESVVSMPYWESIHPAGMKAKEIQLRAQHEIESFEFIGFDDGLVRTLGDVGTITYAPLGLSSETMALTENVPVERGRWRRKYIPYDATDYPSSTSGATTGSTTETVQNPYFPGTGPTPVPSFNIDTGASPNYERIKIDFSPATWAYLKDYKITVTTVADTSTVLYSEYITKGSETGSPETVTTYTDFPVDFSTSPQNAYRVNVYLRSFVSNGLDEVIGTAGSADIQRVISGPTLFADAAFVNGGDSSWNDVSYVLNENTSPEQIAIYDWDEDYSNDGDYIRVFDWPNAIPDGATITNIKLEIRAWKSSAESPLSSVAVTLQNIQAFYAFGTSPESAGPVKSSQAVTFTPTTYEWDGDLSYWGITNEQALDIVGDTPAGGFRFNGNCADTSTLGGVLNLHVDWLKLTVTYELVS